MDTLEMILLFEPTTGGGSMRRGYGTTARRPSARYWTMSICEKQDYMKSHLFKITGRIRTKDEILKR